MFICALGFGVLYSIKSGTQYKVFVFSGMMIWVTIIVVLIIAGLKVGLVYVIIERLTGTLLDAIM